LQRSISDYNRRITRVPRHAKNSWRLARREVDRVCCFRDAQTVSNGKVMQWHGRRFHLPPRRRRFGFAGAKGQFHQTQEGNVVIYYYHGDTKLKHRESDVSTLPLV